MRKLILMGRGIQVFGVQQLNQLIITLLMDFHYLTELVLVMVMLMIMIKLQWLTNLMFYYRMNIF